MKTHFYGDGAFALCGRRIPGRYLTDEEDKITCKACHRVDDARTRRQYVLDCKEAGVEVGEL